MTRNSLIVFQHVKPMTRHRTLRTHADKRYISVIIIIIIKACMYTREEFRQVFIVGDVNFKP